MASTHCWGDRYPFPLIARDGHTIWNSDWQCQGRTANQSKRFFAADRPEIRRDVVRPSSGAGAACQWALLKCPKVFLTPCRRAGAAPIPPQVGPGLTHEREGFAMERNLIGSSSLNNPTD